MLRKPLPLIFFLLPLCLTFAVLMPCKVATAEEDPLLSSLSGEVLDDSLKLNEKTGWTLFSIESRLENHSDQSIMEIHYQLSLLDENGQEVKQMGGTWNGQDTPLAPEGSVEHSIHGQILLEGEVAEIVLTITQAYTKEEVPPIHVPQAGEYLYEAVANEHVNHILEDPPVKIQLWIDQMGYQRTAEVTDQPTLGALTDAFTQIRIQGEGKSVTDNYNGFSLTFEDGETYRFSLELTSLVYDIYGRIHMYSLENLEDFWSLMEALVQEPS